MNASAWQVAPGRWLGVGCSRHAEAERAAREATRAALQGRQPALLIVFSSTVYDLTALPRAVRGAAGGEVPLIGCTTAGELVNGHAGSGHLVVVALGGTGVTVRTAGGMLADGPRAAGVAAAAGIRELDRPHRVLMMLSEGLAGERSEVVRGAYSVAGAAVPLVGAGAGDDLAMVVTHQFFDDEVLPGATIGAAIGSVAPCSAATCRRARWSG